MEPFPPFKSERVSRRRYERERRGRQEAERILEHLSRELYEANAALKAQAASLEETVRHRTEELRAAKVAAETASDAKSAFLAMISHEIRTPLNGVLGMATVLAETELDAVQMDMAEVILTSGNGLLALLNDVLDLSKIEARQMEIEEIGFDLANLMAEQRRIFELRAAEKGLSFRMSGQAGLPSYIQGDPNRLRQVVSNLLSNAMKFTAKGGVHLDVSLDQWLLTVAVTDTGPGVPETKRHKLFKPFSQTDASITRQYGGTGLGLAISRQVCRLMGGDLVFRPARGGGSVFTATMRLSPPNVGAAPVDLGHCPFQKVLGARRWRILVAEDSETNRKVVELLLKPFDLDIRMVFDGAQAVEQHLARPFDLILMDVNMPVMNGLAAASLIRQEEERIGAERVPIIALTANAMTHQVSDYLRQGIDAHVAKPVRREDLARAMALQLCEQTRALMQG
ncbi:ATP-binding protein [Tropicibacter naphthalenivorans]|uniref:histidine kinase n=1 Tax=Tropicibacter naphthalenivorans TaxID=441103 RepID=A0A0P1GZB6_9RHOB|nr:ATP-binding protein [Tropicibacter naphthalenivorans]CUH82523.1 Autoinducer 2 sensor kinase/phosphatase LuxQ [Tropicibacter naphthalenivorans]SMD10651.1 hypothetical protein SAMN04488093_12312 [Tropicibacter naphthalenivorans]